MKQHIQESHDSFFAISLQKNPDETRYRCLVPECAMSFHSDSQRLNHLRTHHSFPKWFRFHLKQNSKKETKGNRQKKKVKKKNLSHPSKDNAPISEYEKEVDENKRQKRRERKERKKEKYSKTPCRFYFPNTGGIGGCRRGDACMFSHDISSHFAATGKGDDLKEPSCVLASETEDRMDIDVEDALSNAMKYKMRVSIPDKISFGGRKRR